MSEEAKTTSSMGSVPILELAREYADLGEQAFQAKYPFPVLVVMYTPPPDIELEESGTVVSGSSAREVPGGAASIKRIVLLGKPGQSAVPYSLSVGRVPSNDIVLPSSKISRVHARFSTDRNGHYHLEDLGSANGTVVNRDRLARGQQVVLSGGDTIAFWMYMFQFVELGAFMVILRVLAAQSANPVPGA